MGYPNNRRFLDNPPTAFLGVLMDGLPLIDTSFDFRIDSAGRDPDKYSPTLRRYHRLLWSKPLPWRGCAGVAGEHAEVPLLLAGQVPGGRAAAVAAIRVPAGSAGRGHDPRPTSGRGTRRGGGVRRGWVGIGEVEA
jgi:hypothetical protein